MCDKARTTLILLVITGCCLFMPASAAAMAAETVPAAMGHESMPGMVWMGRIPAGVGGAGTHHAGKWMLMYKYMRMEMDGNRDGTDGVSTAEVLQSYMVAPESMTMQMHMFGLMYGMSRNLTLMAMVPYTLFEMDHTTRMGAGFTTKSDGIGDVKAVALYALPPRGRHRIHFNAGVSFPTGSIDERGDTPAGNDQKLPYPMQLGSGTWDVIPGVTYRGNAGQWLWGGQALAVFRLGENDNEYTLGSRWDATAWLTRLLGAGFSASARLDWSWWGDIDGADPELNPAMVPTADPDLRSGSRVDALLGANFSGGSYALALEGGVPVYQDLDGPQLETDWRLAFSFQWSF